MHGSTSILRTGLILQDYAVGLRIILMETVALCPRHTPQVSLAYDASQKRKKSQHNQAQPVRSVAPQKIKASIHLTVLTTPMTTTLFSVIQVELMTMKTRTMTFFTNQRITLRIHREIRQKTVMMTTFWARRVEVLRVLLRYSHSSMLMTFLSMNGGVQHFYDYLSVSGFG